MNINVARLRPSILAFLILMNFLALGRAQEVSVPDPGLNAAIRATLQIPTGPLTQPDLLSLTNLNASRRNVQSIAGLEAARNLVRLDLQVNRLSSFSLPIELRKLMVLDLSSNPLTNCFLPDGLTNLTTLAIGASALTNFTLPSDLVSLNSLDLNDSQLASFNLPSNLTTLVFLDLSFNSLTNFSLPSGLTNLTTFRLGGNPLGRFTVPAGLTALSNLYLDQNQLANFTLPAGLTSLLALDLSFNQLTNLVLPADLENLTALDLRFNRFTTLNLPRNLTHLRMLGLRANRFTNFDVPVELASLTQLDLSENPLKSITLPGGLSHLTVLGLADDQLTDFALPAGLTNLAFLNLSRNQLTNLVLPSDLAQLQILNLGSNLLRSITLPAGLTNLTEFYVTANQLTNLTLPPDLTRLVSFGYLGNPLATLVLPELLASNNLAADVAFLRSEGVAVFAYPAETRLISPRWTAAGAFEFALAGPPAVYAVFGSSGWAVWQELGTVTNLNGNVGFTDASGNLSAQKVYRALLRTPPANMVFIRPNTFRMGSPADELDRNVNEGPVTTVTLTRGFWIGKYEVTQGEYLSIMNTNPSVFPGDLTRAVSSVSWPDATNYCAKLTQRKFAAGRIPPGSQYRLPTEAEWECAARAGTSTRFGYGDDPDYGSLTNYAWFADNGGLMVHPVGQKLPNPWGLYDMSGNVWEWCQDWLGPLPGGSQVDPNGPAFNSNGSKVMRGGAYDYPDSSCRSAARLFFGLSPFLTDSDLGFRVVLDMGPL